MEILNNVSSYLSKISPYDALRNLVNVSIAAAGTCLVLDVLSYFTADLHGGVGFYDHLNLCEKEIKPLSPALYFHTFELFSKYMSGSVESISDAFETSCDYKESFLQMTIPMKTREIFETFILGIGIYGYVSMLALMPFINFQSEFTTEGTGNITGQNSPTGVNDWDARIGELNQVTNTCHNYPKGNRGFNKNNPQPTEGTGNNTGQNSPTGVRDFYRDFYN